MATIEWGGVDEKGMPKDDEIKKKEVTLSETLFTGVWNKVDIVLDGVPPTNLGFIRIRDVTHRGIKLSGRLK